MWSRVCTGWVVLFFAATAPAGATFLSAEPQPLGGSPTGLVVVDIDQDGDLDAVTSNGNAGSVSVLVGFSDGTLSRIGNVVAGNVPSALAAVDCNGDGDPDLLVASENDGGVRVLPGLAGPSFDAPGPAVDGGPVPRDIAVGDCNGDGIEDLFIADEGSSETAAGAVTVLIGEGNCSYRKGATLTAGSGTRAIATGDFNGDGELDLVASNTRSNSLSVFLGEGSCGFTVGDVVATGPAPHGVDVGDLDRDGNLDLVVAEMNADGVRVFLGDGAGSFTSATLTPTGTAPVHVAVVDLDGDGAVDVLASNNRSGDVAVLMGDGAGGFRSARRFVADAQPIAARAGDMDGDGRLDVVVASVVGSDGSVAVLRAGEGGRLQAVEDVAAASGPTAAAAGDIDNDGLPDLVVVHEGGTVLSYRARSAAEGGGFHDPARLVLGGRPLGVTLLDVDRDGWLDLVASDRDGARIAVALSNRDGSFGAPTFLATAPQPATVGWADVDGDGRSDLLALGVAGPPGTVSALLARADGSFQPFRSTEVEDGPVAFAAGRFDGDACEDLAVVHDASESVLILKSNCDGTFTVRESLAGVGQGPLGISAGDFDADGHVDLAVGNTVVPPGQPSARIFRGDGLGGFSLLGTARAGDFVAALLARDFGGDLVYDLLAVNQTSNGVRVLRGFGDGRFSGGTPAGVSRMPIAAVVADFDGDGRYDAATINNDPSANNVSLLVNGEGAAVLRGDGNGDMIVSAADLVLLVRELGDGDPAAVEQAAGGGSVVSSAGGDANGDGRVDGQDWMALVRRLFL